MKLVTTFKGFSKFNPIFIIALVSMTIFSPGCSKEKKAAKSIEGKWSVNKFTINHDNILDTPGALFSMDYKKYAEGEGEYVWAISGIYVDIDNFEGKYFVHNDGETLMIEFLDNLAYMFELNVEEDKMELTGYLGLDYWNIKATKK